MKKTYQLFCLALIAGLLLNGYAMAAPLAQGGLDAGSQMERDRRAIEREQVMQQIAEDEAAKKNKVEQGQAPAGEEAGAEVSFALQQVTWNPTEILTQEEIQAVTTAYIGREVTLQDLREMTDRITDLYREKGFMTCGAVLPPQRIHEGVVEIRLIEGKTGHVTLTGNRFTRRNYILKRMGLQAGEVANTEKLNKDLRLFQGTNDIQLRVVMKPGTEEGVTDYDIMVFEPKNQTVTLYMDNDGYKTSGRLREGIFYNRRSLTGQRDPLRAHYLRSQGTNSWGISYSVPISLTGMKLDLGYAGNTTKVVKGELEDLGVKGHSHSYNMTWRVPFHVTERTRHEAGLQYTHQTAQTDLGHGTRVHWVDDKINRLIPYVSFTHYGDSSVLYHKHAYVWARRRDIDGESDTANLYRISAFWQKRYEHGQFWQSRLDGQWGSNDNLASSDRFFIGGVNSVRGYEEGFIGGDRGIAMGIEYHVPLDKEKRYFIYPFFDWGTVGGDTAPAHHKLMSAGLGVEARYKDLYATLTCGFPFKRDFYGDKVNRGRVDFSLSYTF